MTETASSYVRPAWQTDELEDEWPDEASSLSHDLDADSDEDIDNDDNLSYGTRSISLTTPLAVAANLAVLHEDDENDTVSSHHVHNSSQTHSPSSSTRRLPGTFVVRSDVDNAPLFPKTPGRGKMQTFFTPSKLERMFDPPTPPPQPLPTIHDKEENPPALPDTHTSLVNNIAITSPSHTAIEPPQSTFTFAMPPRPTAGSRVLSPHTPHFSEHSTPRRHPASSTAPHPTSETPLRLFQFNYDTYTREHLSALVDSIAVNTPGGTTTSSKPALSRPLSRLSEFSIRGSNTGTSHLRSTKRIKLSSPEEDLHHGDGAGHRATVSRPLRNGKDYVSASQSLMDQIRKKAMDTSTMSTVLSSTGSPAEQRSQPQGLSPRESSTTRPQHDEARQTLLTVPGHGALQEKSGPSGSSPSTSVQVPSSTASTYRQRGADLLAQIRDDMKGHKRLFSEDSEITSFAMQPADKENQKETHQGGNPSFKSSTTSLRSNGNASRRSSRHQQTQRSVMHPPDARHTTTHVFSVPAVPDFNHLVPQPVFVPSEQQQQQRSPLGALSRPSSQPPNEDLNRFVSSSTIASGTTLTTGTAPSFLKQAGPPHLRTIAPGDIPELPEKVGGMVFDKVLLKWVKGSIGIAGELVHVGEDGIEDSYPDHLGREPLFPAEESEDPFGDIESIKDDTQIRVDPARTGTEDEASSVISLPHALDQTGVTSDSQIQNAVSLPSASSELEADDEDDEEEMQLTSFSTDGRSLKVVEVMTPDGTLDGDDSDASVLEDGVHIFVPQTDGFDSTFTSDEEGGRGFEHNLHFQEDLEEDDDSTSISISKVVQSPPASPTVSLMDPIVNSDPAAAATVDTPPRTTISQPQSGTPAIRSVLKNATIQLPTPTATTNPTAPSSHSHGKSGTEDLMTPTNKSRRHRRSVSFSDGKREGPIRGLVRHRNDDEANEMSFAPSARTKRLLDLADKMQEPESDISSDDTPSRGRSHGQGLHSGQADPLVAAAMLDRFEPDFSSTPINSTHKATNFSPSRRRLSRSHSFRSSGPGEEAGQGTFLTECSFGVAHDRLVQVITDVQPFEPHWEDLSTIDLSEKNIESVARLKEFLPHLEGLALNSNRLSWLSGVPKTLRTLSAAHNELTEMTSFGHLLKLVALDISHNRLESLRQLSCLGRLRELRVDGNKVASLAGLEEMHHLVKLSVQGNRLSARLDLYPFSWPQLEVLDLSHNRIAEVEGLEGLNNLVILNLENNAMTSLRCSDVLPKLRILRISGNKLQALTAVDSGRFPNLRTLYADDNRLRLYCSVSPLLARLGKIESLSLRNQANGDQRKKSENVGEEGPAGSRSFALLHDIRDVKRLYLSGNTLPANTALLTKSAYHLVYLELAGCSLKSIPFLAVPLGTIAPNVRVLNLNYNFLDDAGFTSLVIGSGQGRQMVRLERLRKLSVVGSRIGSVKTIIRVLESLVGDEMELVDFRMNPCTLGWYLPVLVPGKGGSKEGGLMRQEPSAEYRRLDTNFRRSLPDAAYVGRLAYRGLVLRVCGERMQEIDGICVGEKERIKAEQVLARIEQ